MSQQNCREGEVDVCASVAGWWGRADFLTSRQEISPEELCVFIRKPMQSYPGEMVIP